MKYPIEAIEAVGSVVEDPDDIVNVLDALDEQGFRLVNFSAHKGQGRERMARLVHRKVYLEFQRDSIEAIPKNRRMPGRTTERGMIEAELSAVNYVLDVLGVDVSTPEAILVNLKLCAHSVRRGRHFIRKFMLKNGMAEIVNGELVKV